ncbi:hypothetical protein ILUMI_20276 [Ignelater luminosus]|uniref:PiggyBac transposable element-derived protein domain-containing protein n=1 Tax=Ignelater luminosus TaxID=2038154 RepID=A0A8K0G2F8_IGNLU|nr:hypothetical protein ILUMI_20276 [Ignelater luminosus]
MATYSFKQFIPSKPEKYGVKIWRERNQGKQVVLHMTKGLETSGRNVITNNFFTSFDLAREMEKKNLTLLGTIRKNKPELPQELVTTRGRDVYSTKFDYQDKAILASYCPKKGKIITLLLTMHDSGQISETEKKKPQMIIDYNKIMLGVDTMDKLVRTSTVKRQTEKCPVTVF